MLCALRQALEDIDSVEQLSVQLGRTLRADLHCGGNRGRPWWVSLCSPTHGPWVNSASQHVAILLRVLTLPVAFARMLLALARLRRSRTRAVALCCCSLPPRLSP